MTRRKRISGTFEWAASTHNCVLGCSHNCRYCYARHAAEKRFKTVEPGKWQNEVVDEKAAGKKFGKRNGTIMFPTSHDITPGVLGACKQSLKSMLEADNNVLVVSKPHFQCIESICREFGDHKERILFRFTIGANDDKVLSFWEPGAPSFDERRSALAYAHNTGFQTSVSMEPVLDWDHVIDTFNALAPHVTNSIWIGVMNKIDERVVVGDDPRDLIMVERLRGQQCDVNFQNAWDALHDHPLVRWKESMKKVYGLPAIDVAGEDR